MTERADATISEPCANCGKPAVERYRPFCSKRCADVDLHRWLSGTYVVPGTVDELADTTQTPPPDEGES